MILLYIRVTGWVNNRGLSSVRQNQCLVCDIVVNFLGIFGINDKSDAELFFLNCAKGKLYNAHYTKKIY